MESEAGMLLMLSYLQMRPALPPPPQPLPTNLCLQQMPRLDSRMWIVAAASATAAALSGERKEGAREAGRRGGQGSKPNCRWMAVREGGPIPQK